ncbi:MAG: LysM peptidoglycan-binding domain-containing protein [Treponema sp.]
MKHIGIKLADGSFYPILEEGKPEKKLLDLTTVQDNQTTVQIDLYRSENDSMEDAEYVDTLEIKNLKPHPNGEPDLNLNISLNDNNELNAEVADPETGKKSETQVTLVSRTLAERNSAPNFALDEKEPEAIDENIEPNFDNTIANDLEEPVADVKPEDESEVPADDIDVPVIADLDNDIANDNSISDDDFAALEKTNSELNTDTKPADNEAEEKEVISSPNNEDFSFDDLTISVPDSDKKEKEEKVKDSNAEDKASANTDEVNIDDFNKAVVQDTLSSEPVKQVDSTDEVPDLSDFETPVLDDSTVATENVEEPSSEEKEEQKPVENKDESSTDDIDLTLPDFSDISVPDSTEKVASDNIADAAVPEENAIEEKSASDETKKLFNESDYTVPDFDTEPKVTPIPEGLNDYFDDPTFNEPDFNDPKLDDTSIDETEEKQPEDLASKDPTYNPQNDISSEDLYDKTENEKSDDDSDEVTKKTKKPVIICIICAIICIIATLLVLFVIPSKFNLLKSRNTKTEAPVVETPAVTEPEVKEEVPPPVEEPVAPAKEDEIVVAPTPEVVPEPPAEPEEKPADISYKIKWGDTLWDIADAYYKNPWRYHKLAKYNHIKNPDLIISGTYLLIPAE